MSARDIPGLRRKGLLSPFTSLLITQFKVEYGHRGMGEKLGLGRKSRQAYLLLGLMALAFLPLMGILYQIGKALAVQSVAIGQPGLPITLAVMMGQFFVFFIGTSALMSTLYYARDLETLQALPVTGRQIVISKVLVAYVAQLLFASALVVPFIIPLGLRIGSPLFWVSTVLVDLTIPAIPLALALLFTVLIMRVTRGLRRRDLFRVVFGLVFFVLIIALQSLNARMTSQGSQELMRAIMQRNGLIQLVSRYYPPLRWAAWAMTGSTAASCLGGLALFAGSSVAALSAVAGGTQRWFLGGVGRDVRTARGAQRAAKGLRPGDAGATAEASGAMEAGGIEQGLFSKVRSPASAVAMRDHWVLTRTPNFLLVTLTNIAVVPIMWLFSSFSGGDLRSVLSGLGSGVADTVILILVTVQGGLAAVNQVSSTSISREGGTFWLSKMIPVPAKLQVRGKVKYSMAVTVVQLATLLIPAIAVFRLDLLHLAALAAMGLLVSWPVTCICILNDLHSPRLTWTEPHQAMKGNLATLGAMLLSAVYLFVGGAAVRMAYKGGLTGIPLYLLVAALAVVSGFVIQRYLENEAGERYRAIEV
jgi:ABC-2 type transport system permease protein